MNPFEPYAPQLRRVIPVYYEADADIQARGIRNKPRRFAENVDHYLNITSRNVKWDVESILPDIPAHIIESWTQSAGWGAIIRKNGEYDFVSGIDAAFGGSFDRWFIPEKIIVMNPYNPKMNGTYTIGENAVLLRNDTFMQGLCPIICPAAEVLTESSVTLVCGLQNLRIITIIRAMNDKVRAAADLFLKKIRWGRQGIINAEDAKTWSGSDNRPSIESLPVNGVPPNYLTQIIEATQYTKAHLLTSLGIPANYNMKRESLNSDEIQADAITANPLIDNMRECRETFCEDVKNVFGADISFEFVNSWRLTEKTEEAAIEEAENPPEEPTPDGEPKEEGEPDAGAENPE